jgi:hypothetical protein
VPMSTMRFAITTVVVATVFAGVAAMPAAAKKPTCKRPGTSTVVQNRDVRVFTRTPPTPSNFKTTILYGCRKRTGHSRRLAKRFDDGIFDSEDFGLVRVRGNSVALYHKLFDVSCKADCPPGFEATTRFLKLVDLRLKTARVVKIDSRPAESRLLIDKHGDMVWPRWLAFNQIEVRALDATGEHVVDSGPIHPESLGLSAAGQLRWTKDGVGKTVALKPTS